MISITLDGLNEDDFRRSIELRLRDDLAGAAVERLRALIAPYAGPGGILPERFLTVTADDLVLCGWEGLADAMRRHDRPGRPITAVSIAFGWAGEDAPQPDADGLLTPHIETSYFNDDAFPFSKSGREDLLDGYSFHGCSWADDCEARESTLSLGGIDDLHGALALLEERLLASEDPDEDGIRAGSLGASLLSVLLFEAVGKRIAQDGLPRPVCVLAGCNGVYPYFDAPVVGVPEEARLAAEAAEEEAATLDRGVPGPRYSSLLVTGIPRAKKRAVLVLDESDQDTAVRIAHLRGLSHHDDVSEPTEPVAERAAPEPNETDAGIIPVPNGPLMTKKPSGQPWDFRDMLPPRAPDLAAAEELPDEPASPQAELPQPEPVDAPVPPRPRFPREASAEPGFALIEPDVHERLQSLIAPHIAPSAEEPDPDPEPVALIESKPDTQEPPESMAPDLGPAWPLGIGWLEDDRASAPDPLDVDEDLPARPGLWSRVRAWFGRGR